MISGRESRELLSSSPLVAPALKKLDEKRLAKVVGVTEIVLGSLIAAKPLAPQASVIGGLGAVGMFTTASSFLLMTPGVWREGHSAPNLSMVGQFLIKDSVLLGASRVVARHPATLDRGPRLSTFVENSDTALGMGAYREP